MIKVFTRFWKLNNARLVASILSIALLSNVAYAQDQQISGTVLDETGAGLPGASVLIKGTSTGTVTDMEGAYSISASSSDVLVVSFIGYTSQELTVGSRSVIDVTLDVDAEQLEEVVVTGYTSQRKRDITAAVSVVDAEDLNTIAAPTFGQKLAGKASGVTTFTSGQPGDGTNIRIRGFSSLGAGGSDPLIIIDGVQIQGTKALNSLNPNDIESMQVLKDASAASIYGSRANAGVIIVTTKRGKAGKIKVSYNGYVGTQKAVRGYDEILLQDPETYAEFVFEESRNAGQAPPAIFGGDVGSPVLPDYIYPIGNNIDESTYNDDLTQDGMIMRASDGTDWWDEVFSTAMITDHNISVSGGNDNTTFSVSSGYFKQDGTMLNTYFDRFSMRANSQSKLGKFSFAESIGFSRSSQVDQWGGNQQEQNTMTQIIKMQPIVPVYDIRGNWGGAKAGGLGNGSNPVAKQVNTKDDVDRFNNLLANFNAGYEFTDWLKVKTSYSIDYSSNFFNTFNFPTNENSEPTRINSFNETHNNTYNWTWTNTISLNKTFADRHTVGLLLGTEAFESNFRQINGRYSNYVTTSTDGRYLNPSLADVSSQNVTSRGGSSSLASYFGKFDYQYDDKYLLSFTLRRDGSSNLLKDVRWGTFPAFSVGWRLSSESFMQNLTFIDDLKIRAGYGVTGNQNIPAGNFSNLYGGSPDGTSYDITGSNGSAVGGYALLTRGNPGTQWEENESTNVGVDLGLLDGRLNIVFDWYKRDIEGLLYQAQAPATAGAATPAFKNVAAMSNTGIDFSVNYNTEISSDLRFNATLNVSRYVNELTKVDGETDRFFPLGVDGRFGTVNINVIGAPISSFYGLEMDGIFQNQTEVDDHAAQTGAQPGRIRYKDVSGPDGEPDNVIDDFDRGVVGNPHPDFTAGLNLGLEYKRFDFNIFLFASVGNEIFNYNKVFTDFRLFSTNVSKDVWENAWRGEGTSNSIPAIDASDNTSRTNASSYFIEDGSFLRARTISLGYNVPKIDALGFESLRVYVQIQNAFTFTKYSGLDPEISNVNVGQFDNTSQTRQNDRWTGFDFGNYPSSRVFMFGVSANF